MRKNGIEADSDRHFLYDVLDWKSRFELTAGNHDELKVSLDGFGPTLFKKDRFVEYFKQKDLVERRFFNWLAAVHSFVEASRQLVAGPRFSDSDRDLVQKTFESDQASFINEIRHFTIHQMLPPMAGYHTASYSATEGVRTDTSLVLLVQDHLIPLLEDRQRGRKKDSLDGAMRYVKGKTENLDLKEEVAEFSATLGTFMKSLRDSISSMSSDLKAALDVDDNPEPISMSESARRHFDGGTEQLGK